MDLKKNTKNRLSREELLRRRAFEERQRAEKEKKKRIIICALSTLLLASVLLFAVAIFELTVGSKYIYVFNSEEKSFNKSDILDGGVQYVDMNSLSELCTFEKRAVILGHYGKTLQTDILRTRTYRQNQN